MFLDVPGTVRVASGMTEDGQKFSYALFSSMAELGAARQIVKDHLAANQTSGKLLACNEIARPIKATRSAPSSAWLMQMLPPPNKS